MGPDDEPGLPGGRPAIGRLVYADQPVTDVKPADVLKPRTVENFAQVGAAESALAPGQVLQLPVLHHDPPTHG